MGKTTHIKVTTREQAWDEANKIFPTDYEKDGAASANAGYDIYRHHELNYYSCICDLGNRLEVLTGKYGENVTNIWVESLHTKPATFTAVITYSQLHDKTIMTKVVNGVEKIERARGKFHGKNTRIIRIYQNNNYTVWRAKAIININLIAE